MEQPSAWGGIRIPLSRAAATTETVTRVTDSVMPRPVRVSYVLHM